MIPQVTSLIDLYNRAEKDDQYKKLIICTLSNLGCEHLASDERRGDPKWVNHYHGLNTYMESMVFEYGQSEDEAEQGIVDEANNLRDCLDHIQLED